MEAVKRIASAGLPSRVFAFSRCMVSDVELALEAGVEGVVMEVPSSRHIIELAYRWPYERAVRRPLNQRRLHTTTGSRSSFFRSIPRAPTSRSFSISSKGSTRDGRMDGLVLVDTFGVLHPGAASFMTRKVKERIKKPLEAHFHMDFGSVSQTRSQPSFKASTHFTFLCPASASAPEMFRSRTRSWD